MWLAVTLGQASVIASLVLRKIAGQFKLFWIYLIGNVLRAMALRWLGGGVDSVAYRTVWVATEAVVLVLQALVVLEFFRLLYRAYPGIQAFARILLFVAMAAAVGLTFGTVQLDVGRIVWRVPDVQRLFVLKRLVSSLLGILLLTTVAFFPKAPSASNILVHGWLLTVLFIVTAGGFFGINVGLATNWMGTVFLTVQLACCILWVVYLRPADVGGRKPNAEAVARTERWNEDLVLFAKWLAG